MKISAVEAIPFTIPLTRPTGFSHASISDAEHVLIRVHTDEGIVGHAEAPARPFTYGESQESIVTAVNKWFAPAMVGVDPLAREIVRERMSWLVHNHTARGATDMAMWDVVGKALGQSVHMLLGGYTDTVDVVHIVFASEPGGIVEEAIEMRERFGFRTFKIKTGKNTADDAKALRGLRAALGEEPEIFVDANKGWSADETIRLLPLMEEVGVTMLEEPTAAFEPLARRRVAARSSIPIMGDESLTRLGEISREILDNHAQIVSLKVARTGFTESARIVGLCEGLGIGIGMGSQMDGQVGTLSSLAFGGAFRSTSLRAGEYDYFLQLTDDLVTESLAISDGSLAVPDRPGVGIEIDEDKLAHYRVDGGVATRRQQARRPG